MSELTNYERLQAHIQHQVRSIRASPETRQILTEIKESLNRVFGPEQNQILNIEERFQPDTMLLSWGMTPAVFNRLPPENADTYIHLIPLYFTVIVHFPEIEITNSSGASHRIYDLYVRFYFDKHGCLQEYDGSFIEGLRASGTVNEIEHLYVHSHLKKLDWVDMDFQPFCTGSGPINMTYLDLHNAFSKHGFQLFCHQLKEYVKWESVEGVPYVKFSTLVYPIGNSAVNALSEQDKEMLLLHASNLERAFNGRLKTMDAAAVNRIFDISIGENRIKIEVSTELELLLASILEQELEVSDPIFFSKKNLNGIYTPLGDEEAPQLVLNQNKRLLTFQNKEIYLKLIDYEASENEDEKYPHPEITDRICSEINRRANQYWFSRQLLVPGSTG